MARLEAISYQLIAAILELMMGLEPMTSPLPRECSTTELHQPGPFRPTQNYLRTESASFPVPPSLRSSLSYRERVAYNTTRNTNSPNSSSAIVRTGPPSSVHQANAANTSSKKTAVAAFCACPMPCRLTPTARPPRPAQYWCTGEDSNLRSSKERQIYSLLPLTARPPVPIFWELSPPTPACALRSRANLSLGPLRCIQGERE